MSAAFDAILDEVAARARASVFAPRGGRSVINQRARRYRDPRHQWQLETLEPNLSRLSPKAMVLRAEAVLDRAGRVFGAVQIVPVELINARAALLLARYERRFSREMVANETFVEAAE